MFSKKEGRVKPLLSLSHEISLTPMPRAPLPGDPPEKEYRRGAGARRARYRAQWGGAAAAFITGGRLNTGVLPERAPGDAPTLAAAARWRRNGSAMSLPNGSLRSAASVRVRFADRGASFRVPVFLKPAIPPPACHALAECLAMNLPNACAGKDFNFTLAARHPCVRKRGPFGIPLWAALPAPAGSAPQPFDVAQGKIPPADACRQAGRFSAAEYLPPKTSVPSARVRLRQ